MKCYAVISKFSVLLANYLGKWHVVKIKYKLNRPLYIDEQINSENSKLFEDVETVIFPFRNGKQTDSTTSKIIFKDIIYI